MAVHAATNASLSTVTAVGNSATFGGAVFVDRTVLLQVSLHITSSVNVTHT